MSESALLSEVCETKQLCENDITRMFDLMTQYFDGVNKEKFYADLTDKKWVIVLRDPNTGEIGGFSTITLMNAEVGCRNIKAFYSGDTIIDKNSRKPFSLEKEWTPFVFSHVFSDPEALWYWFTVCKGFRKDTIYGKRFGFSMIRSVDDFRARIPLFDYSDIGAYIGRIAAGENNVLFPGKPLCMQPTSGSSSASKLIPFTAALKEEYQRGVSPWTFDIHAKNPSLL